jgi:hypothetical protein
MLLQNVVTSYPRHLICKLKKSFIGKNLRAIFLVNVKCMIDESKNILASVGKWYITNKSQALNGKNRLKKKRTSELYEKLQL